MSKQVYLFNCDSTYKLDAVEDLLNATKSKLSFDPVVEKHYFSLSQMSEMTTNIKQKQKLQMDMAFFVVHAHESRLSINEDSAGIGYASIYRALMEATGEYWGGSTFYRVDFRSPYSKRLKVCISLYKVDSVSCNQVFYTFSPVVVEITSKLAKVGLDRHIFLP